MTARLKKTKTIKTVAKVQHPSVAQQLMKHLKSDDKHVRREVARALGGQPTSAKKAGSKLIKLMGDTAEEPKVVASVVHSASSTSIDAAVILPQNER